VPRAQPITARDVNCARLLDRDFLIATPPLINMMDDKDEYGIPSDYYQYFSETPQHYSENVPTSSFDELLDETLAERSFEDFGEYMRVTWVSLRLC
jgi:hypothetical protein